MASQYFAILTDYGKQALAKALSSKQPLQFATFAVGDSNGQNVTPTANRTALVKEKYRANVSAVSLDPRNNKQVIVELTLPENVGGFYIREMGVFDNQNKLLAYANCPESFKPTLESGSGKIQVLRMILQVESTAAVTLSVDHSVIFVTRQQHNPKTITATTQNGFDETGHTHEIAKASTTAAGVVQLSSANNSDDETKAATPKAIKALKALIDASVRHFSSNFIPNSKKSNEVNSPSADNVATSAAVKTAFDRAVSAENKNLFQKIYVSSETVELDLTNRQQIIDLFGDKYRQHGYLTFANHNNAKSKITGLPLETRSPIVMTFYMMNGYSIFYCHYVTLNRKFFSVANLNNATYKLNWVEDITNTGEQTINNQLVVATSGWGKIKFPTDNGGEWRFEFNPNSETEPRFNAVYKMLDGTSRYCSFPLLEKNETVAYRSWVDSKIANNFIRSKLTTQNLNDVKAYGVYAQEANRDATIERNYPTNFAGTLLVYPSAYNVMQQYIDFRSGATYQRNMNIDVLTWSDWRRIDGLNAVSKSGDTMTGNLTLPHINIQDNEAFVTVKSSNNGNASVDFIVQNGVHPQATVRAHDIGEYAVELQFYTTTKGSNYSADRRQHMMTLAHNGDIWTKPYGWLHDFFAKQADNNNIWDVLNNQVVKRDDFIRSWYPNHYNGTEVYKIKHLGLMITLMNATGDKELILPENYDGHFIVLATDRGQGRIPVNSNYGIANNRIRVGGRSDTAVSVLVIGHKSI